MQDPKIQGRDPAYNPNVGHEPAREKGNNSIFFILGAIVVALAVIFFLVSGGDDATDATAPAENGVVIENNAATDPAPVAPDAPDPVVTDPAPDATAPAETAPTPAPDAPAVDPVAPAPAN